MRLVATENFFLFRRDIVDGRRRRTADFRIVTNPANFNGRTTIVYPFRPGSDESAVVVIILVSELFGHNSVEHGVYKPDDIVVTTEVVVHIHHFVYAGCGQISSRLVGKNFGTRLTKTVDALLDVAYRKKVVAAR